MTKPAKAVVHIDDGRFKVTEWRFETDAETGWHVHGHDYVIVPLTNGILALDEPGGVHREAPLTQGVPYSRRVGVSHNVTNATGAPMAFLEVEVVDDAVAHRRTQVLEHFMAAWNGRDVDGLMACMAEDCAFHTSAGPDAKGARHVGRSAVRAAYEAVFDSFPQAAWTEGSHHVMGDVAVSDWRFIGTNRSGDAVDVQGCDLFRFDGDLIALKDSYRKSRTP